MSRSLILDSLEIRNFRAFQHLRIERLGRVNLVTGKNNVGKTCLLEALWLYARRGEPTQIWPSLQARDEVGDLPREDSPDTTESWFEPLRYLFYGREDVREHPIPIQIGPVGSQEKYFSMEMAWYIEQVGEDSRRFLRRLQPEDNDAVEPSVPGLWIRLGRSEFSYPLQRPSVFVRYLRFPDEFKALRGLLVPANGLDRMQTGRLWDSIALTPQEEDLLAVLQIITPVERISFVESQRRLRERIPMARINGLASPIPLRHLGEGMNRLLGIALALVNAEDGLLLIDEIESGLHYSVQPALWRIVFAAARRLNVQVFATTHSWDCIEGFQRAASEDAQAEGLLISLRETRDRSGEIQAVLFDEHELGVATRQQIEVR